MPESPWTFSEVWAAEQQAIAERRARHGTPPDENPSSTLTGLALSGGGVRSATFSLGVLQGLRELKLLPAFDYLSTVSGGGFTGGWWTAWLSRGSFTRAHIRASLTLAEKLCAERVGPWAPPVPLDPPPDTNPEAPSRLQKAWNAAALDIVRGAVSLVARTGTRMAHWFAAGARPERTAATVLSEIQSAVAPTVRKRADLDRELEDKLVDVLNALLPPDSPDAPDAERRRIDTDRRCIMGQLFARYPDELERMFPRPERIDAARAAEYRNDDVPDGAIAAGADPVHHLRLFANYLTPRKGLLSPDTWRAAAVVSRNLILTWLVFLPTLLAVLFFGHLLFLLPFYEGVASGFVADGRLPAERLIERALVAARPLGTLLALLILVTVMWMRRNNGGTRVTHNATLAGLTLMIGTFVFVMVLSDRCQGGLRMCVLEWWNGDSWGWWNYGWLIFTGLCALRLFLWIRGRGHGEDGPRKQVEGNLASRWHGYLLSGLVGGTLLWGLAGFGHELISWAFAPERRWTKIGSGAMAAAAALSALFTALKASPTGGGDGQKSQGPSLASRIVFAATPVLVLAVLAVVAAWLAHAALAWTAAAPGFRLPALTIVALAGVGVCLVFAAYEVGRAIGAAELWTLVFVGLAAVPIVLAAHAFLWDETGLDWGAPFETWRLTAAFGLDILLGFVVLVVAVAKGVTSGRVRGATCPAIMGPTALLIAASCVPVASIVIPGIDEDATPTAIAAYAMLAWLTIMATWIFVLGWMADPNALALHSFYKARLVRAYLGASNPNRRKARADINDPAEGDDMRLAAARPWEVGGPYPLVNTTLNLVGGRDLTTAQRTAAAFMLSPLRCGSVRTGYRPTDRYMGGELSLGAAVATSGAAASPNMGSRTPSAAVAMLLALLNVRLGLWVPTPHKEHWKSPQARIWPYYLLRESLLQTNDLAAYCYLTDGGHFDNTGLYALIERACRFMVVVDDGADPQPCFEDVGDVMRRCRIDFNADITLDASGFEKTAQYLVNGHDTHLAAVTLADRKATGHWAVGSVRYADAHLLALGRDLVEARADGSDVGIIVWIKPALTGDETVDVTQYALQNPAFPQQTTADQWFDEAQFESYRRLGKQSAEQAFAAAMRGIKPQPGLPLTLADVRGVFQKISGGIQAPPAPSRLRADIRFQ